MGPGLRCRCGRERHANRRSGVGDEVRIGEAGNLAVLKKDEWNVLVGLIRAGQLTML
jgi:hypothetical protein